MRIIGGTLSGRKLTGRVGPGTRPTSDRVKEGLSSALQSRGAIVNADVLDLFAGTGALAFEMISRGARSALCIEWDKKCIATLQKNAESLGIAEKVRILRLDLLKQKPEIVTERIAQQRAEFGLVLADPPYAQTDSAMKLLDTLVARAVIAEKGWIAIEHAKRHPLPETALLSLVANYNYGDTCITIAAPERSR